MTTEPMRRLLDEIAAEEIPPDVDLWPSMRARLPVRSTRAPLTRRRALIALGGLAVVLVPALATAAPSAPASLQGLVRRFGLTLIDQNVLPAPPIPAQLPPPPAQGSQLVGLKEQLAEGRGQVSFIWGATADATPGPSMRAVVGTPPGPPTLTLAEAQQALSFHLKTPAWLPAGLALQAAHVPKVVRLNLTPPPGAKPVPAKPPVDSGTDSGTLAGIPLELAIVSYARPDGGNGRLDVFEAPRAGAPGGIVPASAAQSATVGGRPAVFARGGWQKPDPAHAADGLRWDSSADESVLSWEDGGITYVVRSFGLGLSEADLVHVAESLR